MQRRTQSVPSLPSSSISDNGIPLKNNEYDNGKQKKSNNKFLWNILCSFFIVVAILLLPLIYLLCSRLGFGSYFPQQSLSSQAPALSESTLEVVASLPIPPGNLAVARNGRLFFTFHPEYKSVIKVAELSRNTENQEYYAFPSLAFQKQLKSVLSIRIDQQDRLWLLDFAHHGILGSPSLYGFDISKDGDKMVKNYTFPNSVAGFGSMLNDFQVDPTGEFIYIADTSIIGETPALIIYTVSKSHSFRVLNSHFSMFGSSYFYSIPGKSISDPTSDEITTVKFGPLGLKIHVDSIALDRTGSRLYYGAMGSNNLYSISTSHLLSYVQKVQYLNGSSEAMERNLASYVRLVSSEKPITDGMTTDMQGNIWMTAVEHAAIFVAIPVSPKNAPFSGVLDVETVEILKVVESKELLRWPDGLCFGSDGLYITNSALHYKFASKNINAYASFHILRLPLKHLKNNKQLFKKKQFVLPPAGH